jgi:hypothetical protein
MAADGYHGMDLRHTCVAPTIALGHADGFNWLADGLATHSTTDEAVGSPSCGWLGPARSILHVRRTVNAVDGINFEITAGRSSASSASRVRARP